MEGELISSCTLPSSISSSAKWNVVVVIRIHLLKIATPCPSDPPGGSLLHTVSYDLRAIKGLA